MGQFLDSSGVSALWNKMRATFGATLSVNGTTITLKNKAATPQNLSQVTLPNATTGANGAMSAADKIKLDGIDAGANAITVDPSMSSTSENPVQNKAVNAALAAKAPLASPTFTGTPKAPTAAVGTSTEQIATTAFVVSAVTAASVGHAVFQGSVSANSAIESSSYKKGWYWVVGAAGTYVGEPCEAGDMVFANSDKGSAYSASHFAVVQNNIQALTTSEVEALLV